MKSNAGRGWIAAMVLALALAAPPSASAAKTPTPPPLVGVDCVEYQVWAHGDPAAVAARLPARYTPYLDNGVPLVFVRAEHCRHLAANGRNDPMTLGDYGIVITSPDGYGCTSGLPEQGVEN